MKTEIEWASRKNWLDVLEIRFGNVCFEFSITSSLSLSLIAFVCFLFDIILSYFES